MNAILNIGLDGVPVKGVSAPIVVRHALLNNGITFNKTRLVDGKTGERTLVVHCPKVSNGEVYELAEQLNQDCIAVYDLKGLHSELVGPRAGKWGTFNPDYFTIL